MTDQAAPPAAAAAPATPPADPVRRLTLGLAATALLVLIYTLFAERLTPLTNDASVQAFLVRIAPEVAGKVVEVAVQDNQRVSQGQLLFRIDAEPYRIAVVEAEAQLATTGQSLGADTASVQTAQGKVAQAVAVRDNAREQAARVIELAKRGVLSQAQKDQATAALAAAEGALAAAEAELARARSNLGPQGQDNPRLREAMARLEQARLNLIRCEVRAPGDGVITNVQLSPGQYAATGSPAMTYIDTEAVWITALMSEGGLEHAAAGTRAAVLFDALPGRIYAARVDSIGWGIAGTADTDNATGLLVDSSNNSDARRFPVSLVMSERPDPGLRYGSRVTVVLYNTDSWIANSLASGWLRLLSWFTYLF